MERLGLCHMQTNGRCVRTSMVQALYFSESATKAGTSTITFNGSFSSSRLRPQHACWWPVFTIDKRRMRRGSAVHHVKSGTSNACCLASEVWQADEYAKDEPGGHYSGVRALLLCRICLGWGSSGYHSSTLRIPAHPASLVSFCPHLIHITVLYTDI